MKVSIESCYTKLKFSIQTLIEEIKLVVAEKDKIEYRDKSKKLVCNFWNLSDYRNFDAEKKIENF